MVSKADLLDAASSAILRPGVAPDWTLSTAAADSKLVLIPPTSRDRWVCTSCARSHLHPAGGVCTATGCAKRLPDEATTAQDERDNYTWLAERDPRRLRVEELTGQTKPLELQRTRQRQFRGALLPEPDENELMTQRSARRNRLARLPHNPYTGHEESAVPPVCGPFWCFLKVDLWQHGAAAGDITASSPHLPARSCGCGRAAP